MTLTKNGTKKASAVLGLRGETTPKWNLLKGILVELALGKKLRGPRARALSAGAIRAAALARKLGIDSGSTSPSDVLDAWAARELGMADKRLTTANVRAHVLARAIGIGALRDPKRIGTVATAHVLGVPRMNATTVREAVFRDWLAATNEPADRNGRVRPSEPSKPSEPSAPSDGNHRNQRTERTQTGDLRTFADVVKAAALEVPAARFGRHKVFIGPIWNRLRENARLEMKEGEFKAKLVEAHRAGLLRLSRADLTPAMGADLVSASEVSYLNAVFHFVDLEGVLS